MSNKKKVPLQVLEILEPFLKNDNLFFERIAPEDMLLKFKDKDPSSTFFFNIETYKIEKTLRLTINYSPQDKNNIREYRANIDAKSLEVYFNNWVSLLERYENISSAYDDPIIKQFEQEYYSEFEIIEEDAYTKPFAVKQILLIDSWLENVENNIEKFQDTENETSIQEIKQNIVLLRKDLTIKTKKEIIKRFSNICAKISKLGTKLIKEFLSETKKEIFKNGAKFLIENIGNIIP